MKALLTRKKKNDKGFSLIELIIAIAILVILTGFLAPNIIRYIEKSRVAKDMQTLDTVYEAVQIALTEENLKVETTTYQITKTTPLTADSDTATEKTLFGEMYKTLGSQNLTLVSKACKDAQINIMVDSKDNSVRVWAAKGSGETALVEDGTTFQVPAAKK